MAEKNPLGATGTVVARNVRTLRDRQGLTLAELARRTMELGYPLAVLALSNIEKGSRRVDVDDLIVLAMAFNVAPATLLMPPADDAEAPTPVLDRHPPAYRVWGWLRAEAPLDGVGANDFFSWRTVPSWEMLDAAEKHHMTPDALRRLADTMPEGR